MQLTSQLSLSEMLALMQGNLGAITGLHKKLKDILLKKMNQEDTPAKRKELAEGEAKKFNEVLFVPNEVQKNIHEGFEPVLAS